LSRNNYSIFLCIEDFSICALSVGLGLSLMSQQSLKSRWFDMDCRWYVIWGDLFFGYDGKKLYFEFDGCMVYLWFFLFFISLYIIIIY
jgi:hypothetical protein